VTSKAKRNQRKARTKIRNHPPGPASAPNLHARQKEANPRQKCRGYGLLFLLICVIYLCTISDSYWGWISDGRVMFETAVSLREFRELEILPESVPNSGNFEETRHFGKYGIGFSIVQQVPLFFAASVEKALGGGRSNVLFALTNMILTALTALLVALCLRDLGFRYRTGVLAAIGFAFATFAWPYISYDFSEPLQSLCLVASFWLLIRAAASTPPSRLFLALAGFVLGFAVLTKVFLLILIPGYALYLWARLGALQKHRSLAWFALPLGFWSVCIAALNLYRFGSVFDFGYGNEGNQFTTPLLTGLYGLLLSPNKGLLFYAPLTALVPWSLWKMRKSHRCEVIFFVFVIALHLLATSKWWSWEGGTSWGPRLLLPIVPLLVISSAMLLDSVSWSLTPFVACVIAGIGINLLGLLIYFVAWDHVVGLNPARVPLDVTGRPAHEYTQQGGKRWFYPFIAISYVPALSPILGHAWLLRLRYFDIPFSIKTLNDGSSSPLPTVSFPPLELNFELLRNGSRFNFAIWLLRSAHFWLWETVLQQPREEAFTFSIYAMALGKQGERAILQRNPQRALQCYRHMMELMPNSVSAAIKLSQVQLQLGKPLEAQQTLVQFLERHPKEAQVRFQLAHLFELTGNRREALDAYYTYQALHPGDANVPIVQQRIAELSAIPSP
jgi:Tetratricopeptide repeat/Dolichyl-phosphate-mannose-protein mannosyltransferase